MYISCMFFSLLELAERLKAGMPRSFTKLMLSSISDSRGMITKVTPGSVTAESWKVKDLPPPVGIRAKQSRPDLVALMISNWHSLKLGLPKTVWFASTTASSQGKDFYQGLRYSKPSAIFWLAISKSSSSSDKIGCFFSLSRFCTTSSMTGLVFP